MRAARLGLSASGRGAAGLVALALVGCWSPGEPITDCVATGNARPVCGFQRPEDLEIVPGGRYIVVSQTGFETKTPGTLALLDASNGAIKVVYPSSEAAADKAPGWGDPDCPGPAGAFSPHGIHLSVRPDGKLQLLVVNHGGRESVEFFEVVESEAAPLVAWRGCAVASDLFMNDLAALPDGGFVVSHMYPKGDDIRQGIKGMLGFATGYVAQWQPGVGFEKVAGSDARMPNGIAVSADGEQIFVSAYLGNEVLKLARKSGEMLGRVDVSHPDNSQWSADGMLLLASHHASVPTVLACNEIEQGACGVRFSIVEIDPTTMNSRTLYENEGPPMGAGTSVARVGDELVIGSFAGDRIVRVALKP